MTRAISPSRADAHNAANLRLVVNHQRQIELHRHFRIADKANTGKMARSEF
jgi:hypothetical protein